MSVGLILGANDNETQSRGKEFSTKIDPFCNESLKMKTKLFLFIHPDLINLLSFKIKIRFGRRLRIYHVLDIGLTMTSFYTT